MSPLSRVLPNVHGLRAFVQELIPTAFHVNVTRETRDSDVFVITAPVVKTALIEASDTESTKWKMGDGKLEMANLTLLHLAMALERSLGRPVLDESKLNDRYDLKVDYDGDAKYGVLDALRKIGLNVDPARRPIEFLVVTKAQ